MYKERKHKSTHKEFSDRVKSLERDVYHEKKTIKVFEQAEERLLG